MRKVNLIPMAGNGQRFIDEGYSIPKPLIEINGLPMILRSAKSLPKADQWIFICKKDHISNNRIDNESYYNIVIWALVVGSIGIISAFGSRLTELVDLATTISFMIAPFVALANYKLVLSPYIKISDTPPLWLRLLAISGIIFLFGFGCLFIYSSYF